MNSSLERHKLPLILLMLIIFYGTLDLAGWSSSLSLNNDITADSIFPHSLLRAFYPLISAGGACRVLCSWIACISPLKHYFPFPGAAGWVPVYSTSRLFFQQPPLLWEPRWRRQTSPSLLPKSRKSERISSGNIYRSFSWKHECQTLTVLFSCFTFVLLSQNKLILNGMFSF